MYNDVPLIDRKLQWPCMRKAQSRFGAIQSSPRTRIVVVVIDNHFEFLVHATNLNNLTFRWSTYDDVIMNHATQTALTVEMQTTTRATTVQVSVVLTFLTVSEIEALRLIAQ
jgi:hypothetical protein